MRKKSISYSLWKKIIKLIAAVMSALILSIAQTGCAVSEKMPVSAQSFHFDTVCSVTVYELDNQNDEVNEAKKIMDEVFALCDEYEGLLSRTREGTDIYRINHAGGRAVKCDERTIDAIEKGLEYSKLSGGDFDITIGAVSSLWDFHSESPRPPSEADIRKAVKHVGHEKVLIAGDEVSLTDPEAVLDLGGMAKGYIADRICEHMKKRGVKSAVISLGGNVVCIGKKETEKGGGDFRIGIETPYSDQTSISGSVDMHDGTAVTSGVYERYFEADGKKYHHILDPKTGYPADTDLLSVTLLGREGSSCDCDALATICLMKGKVEGKKIIEKKEGFKAIFIDVDGNKSTAGDFDALITD